MSVRIKIAETAAEMKDLCFARHKVFVEEEGYLAPKADGRIVDQFDTFGTTTNFIAMEDNRIVGGIRIATSSPAGFPSDQFFDFGPLFQGFSATIASVSQFFLLKKYRANGYRLGFELMGMCAYWASKRNVTHLVAAVNPVIARLLKLGGLEPVAPKFFHDGAGVEVLPMAVDMNHIKGPLLSTIKRQKILTCPENFDREFFLADEPIFCRNQDLQRDYVVINGRIMVYDHQTCGRHDKRNLLGELGPGQSFREFGLFPPSSNQVEISAGTKAELMITAGKPVYDTMKETMGSFPFGLQQLSPNRSQSTMNTHVVH